VGQTASAAAVATAADAGFAERAVVRALVEAQAGAGPRMTKWSLALVGELVHVLIARLS
jgi:hypothetical protein